ncbi:hypothetical protein TrRE_jg11480 [Triparma retinervis]|uniref:EF-hand domain-containing protein n=1 Tax=Triparma retinervis TaxID=2557542 RepID=A0A9W6ZFZ2_9STRA|nr:hypothetical protein TrRE_jg11480 [Triparma retinervis]
MPNEMPTAPTTSKISSARVNAGEEEIEVRNALAEVGRLLEIEVREGRIGGDNRDVKADEGGGVGDVDGDGEQDAAAGVGFKIEEEQEVEGDVGTNITAEPERGGTGPVADTDFALDPAVDVVEPKGTKEPSVANVLRDLWNKYDVDNSGNLVRCEAKEFIGDDFTDKRFEEVFARFDKDGNGTIEKVEMESFINSLWGLSEAGGII